MNLEFEFTTAEAVIQDTADTREILDDEISAVLEEMWSERYLTVQLLAKKYVLDAKYEFAYFFEEFLRFVIWLTELSGEKRFNFCVDTFCWVFDCSPVNESEFRIVTDSLVQKGVSHSVVSFTVSVKEMQANLEPIVRSIQSDLSACRYRYPTLDQAVSDILAAIGHYPKT